MNPKLRKQQVVKAKKKKVSINIQLITCFCYLEGFDINCVEGHENYEYLFLLDRIEKIMDEQTAEQDTVIVKSELPITKFISTTKTSW